jgi:feruloyl esterase
MSQRFPRYFDGIVAGAPAMRTNYSNLALRWVTTALNSAAPKGPDGKPQTAKALSDTDRRLVIDGLLNACDALDGAKDGMVFATRQCGFDPAQLVCKGNKKDTCLSTQQVVAVKKAFAGPKSSGGRQVYPGFPYDTGIATTRGIPGLLITGTVPEGPAPTGTQMNVDAEAAAAHDARAMLGDSDAWTNLSGFRGHGGRLIFFHGVSDPWFSALETVRYYEQLSKDNDPAPVTDWSRLFLIPGMAHCGGGERTLDRFDMVTAIVNWVEHGTAPQSVVATSAAQPGVSRPLCPYPAHAQYGGSGSLADAANYACRE